MQQTKCINCMKEIAPGARTCPHCGYDQQTEQLSYVLRPNTILYGRYLVGRVIGKGGFGITYVGFDLTLEMKVAIKEYYPSGVASRNNTWSNQVMWESGTGDQDARAQRADSMDRVLKEARRTARLADVPSVVRVTDAFCENETAYLVMDFIEGITLKEYLMQHGVLTWEECKQLLFPVMEGLAEAHDMGIIHRDISPDNIMIGPDGTAKLLDLGAAVDISLNEGQASTLVVKNHFSAVEQYDENGRIGSWTDVYAFAAMLYYCLTGKLMVPVMDRLMSQSELTFPPQPEIPEHVKNALKNALEINHANRTPDMRTFAQVLTEGEEGAEKLFGQIEAAGSVQMKSGIWKAGESTRTESGSSKTMEGTQTGFGSPKTGDNVQVYTGGPEKDKQTQSENGKATGDEQNTIGNIANRTRKKLPILLAGLLCAVAVIGIAVFAVQSAGKLGESSVISNSANNETGDETENDGGSESTKDSEVADGTETSDGTDDLEKVTGESESTAEENGEGKITADDTIVERKVLRSDVPDELSTDAVFYVFGSEWTRDVIAAITILDTLEDEPADSWDVSEDGDRTVKAWVKEEKGKYHLYLGAEGGIFAPADSSYLFCYYENCTYIEWNGSFDTSNVTSMYGMFYGCNRLTELDVSGFDTSNVT
ncbi:MAG: protein kinase, partial [Lachnospiraceae bacterium]|nr:protein kinase [Lachnospiraceae bacterium]